MPDTNMIACPSCRAKNRVPITRVKIVKVNMDENTGVGSRFSVARVPTLLLVKGGRVTETLVGALPKEQIEAAIERII
jgi:thioredoxin-like negative regulator of GroEL